MTVVINMHKTSLIVMIMKVSC